MSGRHRQIILQARLATGPAPHRPRPQPGIEPAAGRRRASAAECKEAATLL